MTDEFAAYYGLNKIVADHSSVHHGEKEYVRGIVDTNFAESYFSLLIFLFSRGESWEHSITLVKSICKDIWTSLIFAGREEMKMTETIHLLPLRVLGEKDLGTRIHQTMPGKIKKKGNKRILNPKKKRDGNKLSLYPLDFEETLKDILSVQPKRTGRKKNGNTG